MAAYEKMTPLAGDDLINIGRLLGLYNRLHNQKAVISAIEAMVALPTVRSDSIPPYESKPMIDFGRLVEAMARGVPTEPLARYFEYWLLRLQGVYGEGARMSGEARAFLDAARGSSPFALGDVKVSRHTLHELEAAHRSLIALHLEKDLKSVRVLREMRR